MAKVRSGSEDGDDETPVLGATLGWAISKSGPTY